ncbi:MAG: hypothetical protein NTV94_18520 [Planctomycetota bacterium]|nr:hypothetical protein [Planctomycetota bacterium]
MMRALALGLLCSAATAQSWSSLGPSQTTAYGGSTGRIAAIACSPINADTYFIAAADGGIWRTTNAGSSWTPLTDHLPTSAFGALLIDPATPTTIYAGSGEANFAHHSRPGEGLFRSSDNGTTWVQRGSTQLAGRSISRLALDSAPTPRLYAALTRAGGFPGPTAAKNHPGALNPRGIWFSTDRGDSWSPISSIPDQDITDFAIEPGNSDTLYAAIGTITGSPVNGIWKSTDRGISWSRLSGGLPAATSTGRIGLAIAPNNPARLYAYIALPADTSGAGAITQGAYRSDDRGVTWTAIPIGDSQATYGWYFTTIGINPTNAADVCFGALSLFRSTTSGTSLANLNIPHPDVHAITFDAAGRLVAGCDGGIYRYANSTWTTLNTGLTITQCMPGFSTHPTDDSFFMVGLQDNGSLRRSGNTTIWTWVTGGDGGWTQIDPTNPSRIFTESQGTGNLYRSTNGGISFSGLSTGITGNNCFLPPYLIDPSNPSRIYYATERLWLSTNGGTSFAPLSPDLTNAQPNASIRSLAIAPSDPRYIYAATNNGRILASSNSGVSFSLIRSNNPGWPRTTRELFVDPTNPRTLYLAAAAYNTTQVLRTQDAGITWEPLDAGLPDLPVNTIAADERTNPPRLYAGTESGVYWSLDDGTTWEPFGSGLPHALVNDIRLETNRNRLVISTQGRGIWSIPIDACIADFNHDGGTDGSDIEAFFLAWQSAQTNADVNIDGGIDGSDIETFFLAWESGC